jgi:hypothetical protein
MFRPSAALCELQYEKMRTRREKNGRMHHRREVGCTLQVTFWRWFVLAVGMSYSRMQEKLRCKFTYDTARTVLHPQKRVLRKKRKRRGEKGKTVKRERKVLTPRSLASAVRDLPPFPLRWPPLASPTPPRRRNRRRPRRGYSCAASFPSSSRPTSSLEVREKNTHPSISPSLQFIRLHLLLCD